jgi:hypothetical protein
MQEYRAKKISAFLLQAVIACSIPHVSIELLQRIGFKDHPTAQKAFATRAKLLYDFDVEQNQLRLLQGSLLLSTTHVSHFLPRDHRFWLSNAAYVAGRMRLHQKLARPTLDISTKRLFRRIWWVLYTWDVLLALNGMDTMRRIRDTETVIPRLAEEDWDEEFLANFQTTLQPVESAEKSYMVESCKLSMLSRLSLTLPLDILE